jgi:hypothetical protein
MVADVYNFVVVAGLTATLWALATRVGLSAGLRVIVCAWVVNSIVVTTFVGSSKDDILVATLFLAALLFVVEARRQEEGSRTPLLALAGLTLAMLAGVKLDAVPYAVLVVGCAVLLVRRRETMRLLLALASFAIVFAGGWLARNAIVAASDPHLRSDLNHSDLSIAHVLDLSIAFRPSASVIRALGSDILSMGSWWVLPGVLAALWLAMGFKRAEDKTVPMLGIATLVALAILLLTPNTVFVDQGFSVLRFGLGFYVLTGLTFLLVAQRSQSGGILRAIAFAVLAVSAVSPSPTDAVRALGTSKAALGGWTLAVAAIAAVSFAPTMRLQPTPRRPKATERPALAIALLLVAMLVALGVRKTYDHRLVNRLSFWDNEFTTGAFTRSEAAATEPVGSLVIGMPQYPFYGATLENAVIFQGGDWSGLLGGPSDRARLLELLSHADRVALHKVLGAWPAARDWLRDVPSFSLRYSDDAMEIYARG